MLDITSRRPWLRPALAGAALAGFLVLQVVLTLRHEPWRDEADTWLVARHASPAEIVRLMPHAGTPSLWYWLLVPFAKPGAPILAQQLLHLVVAVLAGAVLLFRSPFPFLVRVLALFGYYLSFEYAVISRPYVLTALILWLTAALHGQRDDRHAFALHLLLGLLANVNAHSFLLAGVLFSFEVVGQLRRGPPRAWRPFLLSASGLTVALWQLWPPGGGPPLFGGFNVEALIRVWPSAFLPDHVGPLATGAALLVVASSLFALRRQPRLLALLLLGWAALLYVFVFRHVGGTRHYGLVYLWFLFCLWMAHVEDPDGWGPLHLRGADASRRLLLFLFGASLFVSTLTAARFWSLEVRDAFSDGKGMAAFLIQKGLSDRPIAAYPAPHSTSVLAQLPKRSFWYPGIEQSGSYMKWDGAYARGLSIDMDEVMRRIATHFPDPDEPLLLLNRPLADLEVGGYRLLHETPGRIFWATDERFFLYEPRRELPDGVVVRGVRVPRLSGTAPQTRVDRREDQLTIPVVVETGELRTELALYNESPRAATFHLDYVEALNPGTGRRRTASIVVSPRAGRVVPDLTAFLRSEGALGLEAPGDHAGALRMFVKGVPAGSVSAHAALRLRTESARGGHGEPEDGIVIPAVPRGREASDRAELPGLIADADHRTNVAVVNAGRDDEGAVVLRMEVRNPRSLGTAKRNPFFVSLSPGRWAQVNSILTESGVARGTVEVTRVSGTAPWVAYAVVNEGGRPGQTPERGTYVPMQR